jgi:uroporphyrinogen-III synthase
MQPLKNKTVLITRLKEQSFTLADKIKEFGGVPVSYPLIQLVPINCKELKHEVNNNKFDWIIFTSVQAVDFFFQTISATQIKSKIAVVGNTTKKSVEDKGISVDFIPTKYTAKQLAQEIPIQTNQHIFIPRSDLAKKDIDKIIEERNCIITTLPIYKNISVNYSLKEIEELNNQVIDFVTFTSGSAVRSFVKNGIEITNRKVICIGPETANVAEDNNIEVDAIADPYTIEGMLDALIKINNELNLS